MKKQSCGSRLRNGSGGIPPVGSAGKLPPGVGAGRASGAAAAGGYPPVGYHQEIKQSATSSRNSTSVGVGSSKASGGGLGHGRGGTVGDYHQKERKLPPIWPQSMDDWSDPDEYNYGAGPSQKFMRGRGINPNIALGGSIRFCGSPGGNEDSQRKVVETASSIKVENWAGRTNYDDMRQQLGVMRPTRYALDCDSDSEETFEAQLEDANMYDVEEGTIPFEPNIAYRPAPDVELKNQFENPFEFGSTISKLLELEFKVEMAARLKVHQQAFIRWGMRDGVRGFIYGVLEWNWDDIQAEAIKPGMKLHVHSIADKQLVGGGSVEEIDGNNVTIRCLISERNVRRYRDDQQMVTLIADKTPKTSFARASAELMNEHANYPLSIINMLLGKHLGGEPPSVGVHQVSYLDTTDLNDKQKQAAANSLEHDVSMIVGPPGTGKSHVIKHMAALHRNLSKRVLVVAPGNRVLDDIALKMKAENIPVVRIVSDSRMNEYDDDDEVCSLFLNVMAKSDPQWEIIENMMHQYGLNTTVEQQQTLENHVSSLYGQLVRKANPVILTTTQMANCRIIRNTTFDFMIVEEAAAVLDSELLVCIVNHKISQLCLIGDPYQLPPLVRAQDAKQILQNVTMRRLLNQNAHHVFLDKSYRMIEPLLDFPVEYIYNREIGSGRRNNRRIYWNLMERPVYNVAWVNVGGKCESRSVNAPSFFNVGEAQKLVEHLECMLRNGHKHEEFAVLVPYAAQKKHFQQVLPQGIFVSTIDAFQGREADIVLLSMVISEDKAGYFLMDWNRLNVAITRAKYALIIFGNASVFIQKEPWKSYINYLGMAHCVYKESRNAPGKYIVADNVKRHKGKKGSKGKRK